MFRDPSHFLAIRQEVVPLLKTYPSIKIWIAGCSTGEEVYSMAILLREEGLLERTIIYATDINPASLDKAKQGIFSQRIAAIAGQDMIHVVRVAQPIAIPEQIIIISLMMGALGQAFLDQAVRC